MKSGCKMLPAVGVGNSFLGVFFGLVHPGPSTGNQKEDVDEDTPAGTFYVWKEVLRSVATLESLGVPVQHT